MKIYPAIARKTKPLTTDTVAAYIEFSVTLANRLVIISTADILANTEPCLSGGVMVDITPRVIGIIVNPSMAMTATGYKIYLTSELF